MEKGKRIALLSVYDKNGIVEFARSLVALGWSLLASGGTAKTLTAAGLSVADVAELVGGGAILGHRVVTLSREVHAGLLSTDLPADVEELEKLGIPRIDLVCVDLYPLEEEIVKAESTRESVIEKTDIGGPTMLRSAAKGQRIVICDPRDRMAVVTWLEDGEPNRENFIRGLQAKAEYVISRYCAASAAYHGPYKAFFGELVRSCRYGENAYQSPAGLYSSGSGDPLALDQFQVIQGNPGYNNWADVDRLLQTVTRIAANFERNFGSAPLIAVGGKHGNACGAAVGEESTEVIRKMIEGDPLALFGGLVMTNFPIGEEEAELLHSHAVAGGRRILDGIIAPEFLPEAFELLKRKGDKCSFLSNLALYELGVGSLDQAPRFRYVRGGFLTQPNYSCLLNLEGVAMGEDDRYDMLLAHAVCQTSNSNTITLVKDRMLIGNGVGQQSRVGGANLAITRARDSGHDVTDAVASSDSYFPFTDGVETLVEAGVRTIQSTSGSVNDQKVIDYCQTEGILLHLVPDKEGRGFFGH